MTTWRSSMSLLGSGGAMGGGDAGDVSDFVVSPLVSDFLVSNVFCGEYGEYEGVMDSPYENLTEREI